ncbi:DUF2269 family protein [Achromobacter sp. 413638]|jgi:uncharacterized membrane protein|uniref:DUF2269 family protein n=1 Tax=Achromobacter sp. 413638 TaxID=3342385 RepID=UPI00370C1A3F
MNAYLLLKSVHIVSSVLMVGTGLGSAFYMFFTNRSGNVAAQAVVSRLVVRADWWFTTPCVIIQPISGIALAHMAGWSPTTPWLALSIGLYALAGACWLPVVWLQLRMAAMARDAHAAQGALPERYARYARRWEALGYPAFIAMAVTYYLMVNKPALWGG